MALTKPKLYQFDTSVTAFSDPITVLHQGATSANLDVGFLFNRANGLVSNVAVYWSESAQSMVTAFTANSGGTDSNIAVSSYANLTIGNLLMVNGSILNVTGNINANIVGTNYGNVNGTGISSFGNITTTNGVFWANGSAYSSGSSSYGNTQVASYLPTYTGSLGASALTVTQTGTGNQYALTMKGNGGDQWAFTVGSTAGQNNITSLNTAGSAYAPFTVNGSSFTIGTTGAGATTSLSIDNTGATTVTGNLTYGNVAVLNSSSTTASIGTAPRAIDSFATATYRGAKYLVSTTDVTNSQYQMAEIVLTQDGVNVGISVYGVSYTGTSQRMTFTANIASGALTLYGTGVSANNTVKLARTLIPV